MIQPIRKLCIQSARSCTLDPLDYENKFKFHNLTSVIILSTEYLKLYHCEGSFPSKFLSKITCLF